MHVILILVATAGHWIGILFKCKWKQWICKGACYDMLAAYWFLTASWVEKLLSSDVSEDSSRTRPGLDALFWFRCWSERQNKSRAYWFLKHSLSQSAYCLLPLETLLSILHDLPSQSSSLWHAAISAIAQGMVSTFVIKKKKNHSSPLWLLHFVSIWDISGASSSAFAPLYHFPHVTVFSMHD